MVPLRLGLARLGQEVLQVLTPARWVVALPQPVDLRPVQHALDAAAHAGCGLRLGRPDRLQACHNQAGVDLSDGQQFGWAVVPERLGPLVGLCIVRPASAMRIDVGLCGLAEGGYCARAARWASMGASPPARCLRCSSAAARASCRLTA